jgi:HAD superfamily hydrolase (TIGR01509 family)
MEKQTVKTVFLDNDGVLVDTEKYYFEASRHIAEQYGFELTREKYQELFLRTNGGFGSLGKQHGWPEEKIAAVRAGRDAIYKEYLATREIALAGVAEGLARLSARFELCVVTSSPRPCFDIIHGRTGFTRFFTKVVSEEQVKNHKPDPEPYCRAMEIMKAEPESSIAVEDSERGLAAAVGAGLRCIIVPRELTKDQDFNTAFAVVGSFLEAVELIKKC